MKPTCDNQHSDLPVSLAYNLSERPIENSWLIEELWAEQAVGILGGEPKCCKSFLALDMAVAVASGKPCLRRFPVARSGPVLLFPAEDSTAIVRSRLAGICNAAQTSLSSLPLYVITAPRLLLDQPQDCLLLRNIVAHIKPLLLILDPFIRLHRADENASNQVAPILGHLRDIQRDLNTAVLLVHHVRKRAGKERPGQALRGSSDLHGWGDCNLYLRRKDHLLTLSIEHRAAPDKDDISLQLHQEAEALALRPVAPSMQVTAEKETSLSDKEVILNLINNASKPLSTREVRDRCSLRMERVCSALKELRCAGQITTTVQGYLPITAVSQHPIEGKGNGKQQKLTKNQMAFAF